MSRDVEINLDGIGRDSPDKVQEVAYAICYANCISYHPGDTYRAECQAANGWDMWVPEALAAIAVMERLSSPPLGDE
ncbi:hypothetical protein GG804_29090 [Sphingomonas histidinilytica]|uniref:hypothetical protein n=1 Tax=Rhizorhabdus histidinilytica TaxID=439228 RepID=UPI001ADCCB05|nr:hypothetical protein [Rhizorhabdus histidinilytica]MBO9380817.1 hypothetical protein [Rhizorhabdus histidinilytica]